MPGLILCKSAMSRPMARAQRWAIQLRPMHWLRRCAQTARLMLKHGRIPASLHFETPNPNIDFASLKLRVPVVIEPFPHTGDVRMAGVNSFGFGGANVHVILTEAPPRAQSC